MKRNPIILLIILSIIPIGMFIMFYLFFGMEPNELEDMQTTIEGVVADTTESTVLLVEGVSKQDVEDLTIDELLEEATEAHRITIEDDIEDIEVGMRIVVWVDAIRESYPTQSTASNFEIVE